MTDTSSADSLVYPIYFHRFTKTVRNLEFKGKGTLEISSDGDTFTFRGKGNALFAGEKELCLRSDQISDVKQLKDHVMLRSQKGESQSKNKPFTFYCENEKQAKQLVELLPSTASEKFAEDSSQMLKLDEQCPPFSFITSPTNQIIGTNMIIFILMASIGGTGWIDPVIEPYIRFGASNGAYTTNGEWWRLLSCMFLHYGLVHVLMNCWVLIEAGHLLERLVGRSLFFILYFGTGIFSGLASIIWYKDTVWSAGASGAVFGIYGALLAFSLLSKKSLPNSIFAPLRKGAIVFIGYNFLYGSMNQGIDNAAHVGGLVSGLILGSLASTPIDLKNRIQKLSSNRIRSALGALLISGTAIAFTPRFDYNPYHHYEFFDQWTLFGEADEAMIDSMTIPLDDTTDTQTTINFLSNQAIPFYQGWNAKFDTDQYRLEKATERNRQRLAGYCKKRAEAFEALIKNYKSDTEESYDRYLRLIAESYDFVSELE